MIDINATNANTKCQQKHISELPNIMFVYRAHYKFVLSLSKKIAPFLVSQGNALTFVLKNNFTAQQKKKCIQWNQITVFSIQVKHMILKIDIPFSALLIYCS